MRLPKTSFALGVKSSTADFLLKIMMNELYKRYVPISAAFSLISGVSFYLNCYASNVQELYLQVVVNHIEAKTFGF